MASNLNQHGLFTTSDLMEIVGCKAPKTIQGNLDLAGVKYLQLVRGERLYSIDEIKRAIKRQEVPPLYEELREVDPFPM